MIFVRGKLFLSINMLKYSVSSFKYSVYANSFIEFKLIYFNYIIIESLKAKMSTKNARIYIYRQ